MITFSKTTADDMEAFKDCIREQIIEMAAYAIGPIYGNWNDYDEEVEEAGRKLEAGEISYEDARKIFAEYFYKEDLDDLTIIGNKVVFRDAFHTDNACLESVYCIGDMVHGIKEVYPDMEAYGMGNIDYHNSCVDYLLVAHGDCVVDWNTEYDDVVGWISWLYRLSYGYTIKWLTDWFDGFSLEKLHEEMARFLKENGLKLSVGELLEKFGMEDVRKMLAL